jgi:hypothetical protein
MWFEAETFIDVPILLVIVGANKHWDPDLFSDGVPPTSLSRHCCSQTSHVTALPSSIGPVQIILHGIVDEIAVSLLVVLTAVTGRRGLTITIVLSMVLIFGTGLAVFALAVIIVIISSAVLGRKSSRTMLLWLVMRPTMRGLLLVAVMAFVPFDHMVFFLLYSTSGDQLPVPVATAGAVGIRR